MRLRPVMWFSLLNMWFLSTVLAGQLPPVPSYQKALEEYQKESRQAAEAPKISASDRATMEQAAQELAREMPNPGLRVGEKAPDFTLPNAHGQPVTLSEQLAEGPVVLTFYRGAWCPYCNLQLRGLRATYPHIQDLGAQLLAVTPQKPDKSLEQVKQDGYPFEILSDLDSNVMKEYRLYFEVPDELSDLYKSNFGLDLADYNGDGRYVLPVPGTYVIDRDGLIRAAFADTDYRNRIEPAEILAVLAVLNKD